MLGRDGHGIKPRDLDEDEYEYVMEGAGWKKKLRKKAKKAAKKVSKGAKKAAGGVEDVARTSAAAVDDAARTSAAAVKRTAQDVGRQIAKPFNPRKTMELVRGIRKSFEKKMAPQIQHWRAEAESVFNKAKETGEFMGQTVKEFVDQKTAGLSPAEMVGKSVRIFFRGNYTLGVVECAIGESLIVGGQVFPFDLGLGMCLYEDGMGRMIVSSVYIEWGYALEYAIKGDYKKAAIAFAKGIADGLEIAVNLVTDGVFTVLLNLMVDLLRGDLDQASKDTIEGGLIVLENKVGVANMEAAVGTTTQQMMGITPEGAAAYLAVTGAETLVGASLPENYKQVGQDIDAIGDSFQQGSGRVMSAYEDPDSVEEPNMQGFADVPTVDGFRRGAKMSRSRKRLMKDMDNVDQAVAKFGKAEMRMRGKGCCMSDHTDSKSSSGVYRPPIAQHRGVAIPQEDPVAVVSRDVNANLTRLPKPVRGYLEAPVVRGFTASYVNPGVQRVAASGPNSIGDTLSANKYVSAMPKPVFKDETLLTIEKMQDEYLRRRDMVYIDSKGAVKSTTRVATLKPISA